jgi:23S rRNA (uracil1939-C5)-methyltransferase
MNESDRVTIEKIVAGGVGLGRLDHGMVVLVPRVLPGEEVRFAGRRRHKSFLEADPVEILNPAPNRISPPCEYYQECGGCDLQHTDYPSQLIIKEGILRELLVRGKICDPDTIPHFLLPSVPSPDILSYRQRLRLQVDENARPGFYRCRSHEIVPVRRCLLAGSEINSILELLHTDSAAAPLLAACESVELLLNPRDSRVLLLFQLSGRETGPDLESGLKFCRGKETVQGMIFRGRGKGTGPYIINTAQGPVVSRNLAEELRIRIPVSGEVAGRPFELTLEPGGFCQVNRRQNEKCMGILLDWAAAGLKETVLDLYCGMGNFSIPLAMKSGGVTGLDLEASSIRSAARNADLAGLSNCGFIRESALAGITRLAKEKNRFDLLLLDPPRAGCSEVIPHISGLGIRKILMVSCDPATLVRDLKLLQKSGYTIERQHLVDMFPQTHHLETITLLSVN